MNVAIDKVRKVYTITATDSAEEYLLRFMAEAAGAPRVVGPPPEYWDTLVLTPDQFITLCEKYDGRHFNNPTADARGE